MNFDLGSTVEDAVTGFRGIAIQRRDMLSGNIQYAVQPRNKEGENVMPEAQYIDAHMLNFVDAGVSARATKATAAPIPLGSKVRDTVTGLEGVATARATFLNGCVYYDVIPKKKTAMFDANPDPQFVDGVRLKVVKEAEQDGLKPAVRTGGPSSKVSRQAVQR
jgi:hypothetical protein